MPLIARYGRAPPTRLKVGFIYVGPIGDFGWSYQHDVARKALDKALGDKVETIYVENVPEGPDAERAIEGLVRSGCEADLHHLLRLHGLRPSRSPSTIPK